MVKLTDVAEIKYGCAFDSKSFTDDDSYPQLVRIRDVKRGFSETFYKGEYSRDYVLSAGDLLVGMDGEFNIARWKVDGALLNQRVCKIVARPGTYEEYLRFILGKVLKEIEGMTSFATVKHLSAKELNKLELDMPKYEEQVHRSSVLLKVEDIIDKRRLQLDNLDELVRARFVELFGDPLNNTKGWGEQRLGECCVINPKKNIDSRLEEDLVISFIPMASVSENGEILKLEDRFYRDVKNGFTYFCEGDVLFAKITPCMENGKGAVAVGLKNSIGFGSTEFHVLRPIKEKSNSYWLYVLTSFDFFRKKAEENMTGSAGQKRVQASFLENIKISVPPITLQIEFEQFVHQVNKSKVEVKKALDKAQLLFDSLMQKYFG